MSNIALLVTESRFPEAEQVNNSTVYCHFELERFPKSEFYRDEEGRRIHRTEPLHTSEGALIEDPGLPPPPTIWLPDDISQE